MISFAMYEFRLYAPATVNGRATNGLIDTGATRCSISPDLAEGMRVERTALVHGALSAQQSNRVRLESLSFLDATRNDLEVSVGVIEAGAPFEVGCLLDATTLLSKPLTLSFKEQQIGFVETPLRDDLMRVPLEILETLPFITCVLDGEPLHTIFDTGAGYSVINSSRRQTLAPRARLAHTLNDVGDANQTRQTLSVWESGPLEVGSFSLGNCAFLEMDLSALETKLQTRVDFILGVNTLLTSNPVLVLDAPNREFGIAPYGTRVTKA